MQTEAVRRGAIPDMLRTNTNAATAHRGRYYEPASTQSAQIHVRLLLHMPLKTQSPVQRAAAGFRRRAVLQCLRPLCQRRRSRLAASAGRLCQPALHRPRFDPPRSHRHVYRLPHACNCRRSSRRPSPPRTDDWAPADAYPGQLFDPRLSSHRCEARSSTSCSPTCLQSPSLMRRRSWKVTRQRRVGGHTQPRLRVTGAILRQALHRQQQVRRHVLREHARGHLQIADRCLSFAVADRTSAHCIQAGCRRMLPNHEPDAVSLPLGVRCEPDLAPQEPIMP